MIVILGTFRVGQDQRLQGEEPVTRGLDSVVVRVLEKGSGRVLLDVNNECCVHKYVHEIPIPGGVSEPIARVRGMTWNGGGLMDIAAICVNLE